MLLCRETTEIAQRALSVVKFTALDLLWLPDRMKAHVILQ
jgi:hypothetical protein